MAHENRWVAYATVEAINKIQSKGGSGYATYGAQGVCTYMVAEPRADPHKVIETVIKLKVSKSVMTLYYSMEDMVSKAGRVVS